MSHLVAVVFDDPHKGEEARAALHRMAGEGLLEIDDTVLIRHAPDGKMSVTKEGQLISKGQKAGHVLGLIAAAITGTMPETLDGTLAGRLLRRLMDPGITRTFITDVKNEVGPGKSALIVLAQSDPERRELIANRLQSLGPKVLNQDVPQKLLEKLEADLQQDRAA